jgi:hypothetical protein
LLLSLKLFKLKRYDRRKRNTPIQEDLHLLDPAGSHMVDGMEKNQIRKQMGKDLDGDGYITQMQVKDDSKEDGYRGIPPAVGD